jgi:hypothetical protein
MKDDKSAAGPGFDPRNVKVFVVTNGASACADKRAATVVDQEPVYFFLRPSGQPFPITWHLQTRGYSFVPQIAVADPMPVGKSAPGEIGNCRAGGPRMTCTNKNQNTGQWKYTLRIAADDGCGNPEDLDPVIGND